MKEYKLAVVGATGLVGRKVIEVLEEYQLPISSCEFFASRKSAGTDFYFNGKRCLVKELKELFIQLIKLCLVLDMKVLAI